MKFLFLSSFAHLILDPESTTVSGGAELQAALMARELSQRGHEVVIIGGDTGQAHERVFDGVRCLTGGKFHTGGLADTLQALPIVLGLIKRERPDFSFVYGWTTWLFFLLWAKIFGHTKVGFTCMLDTEVNGVYRRENPLRGALFEYGIRRSDVRYAITDYEVECFDRMGLSVTLYRPLIMNRKTPASGAKNIDFLWISRCQPIKRPHLFLDLVERMPEARFMMVSPAENAELFASVQERARTLPNLQFFERVPYSQVQALYDRSHVFVNTSTWEGFANSFIQAGQAEAAILSLAVDTDGLLERFGAGSLAADNFETFLQQAQTLLSDEEFRRRCQAGSARFVSEWHNNERNVEAFLTALPR